MRKIPTIFLRDGRTLTTEHHPDCEWVFAGEGVPTRKYDGTCCMVRNGKLYKRREIKTHYGNPERDYPPEFELEEFDPETRKAFGWVPVNWADPTDRWHRDGYDHTGRERFPLFDGTYELIGPKIQGNPERVEQHMLIAHASADELDDVNTVTLDHFGLREYLAGHDIEGIVWHHPDGRMAKIKGRDFGLKRAAR